jgi:hypothetical protein
MQSEEGEHLDRLLDLLPEPMWAAIPDHSKLESASERHRTRWQEVRRAKVKAASGALKIMLAMETNAAPAEEIVESTLALFDDKKPDQRVPLQEVAEQFPEVLAQKLVARVLDGRPLPFDGTKFITGERVEESKPNSKQSRSPRSAIPNVTQWRHSCWMKKGSPRRAGRPGSLRCRSCPWP